MKWWSNALENTHPFDNTWKQNLVDMDWRFGAWLMLSLSMCRKWKCVVMQVMRMLSMQLDTWLSVGWRITLSHVIIFFLTLHWSKIFSRLGWMPHGLVGLIGRGGLVLWLLIQREDQEDNSSTTCMLQERLLQFLGLMTNQFPFCPLLSIP